MDTAYDPRYPLGPFTLPETITPDKRHSAVLTLGETPEHLRDAVRSLDGDRLNTPYREDGWTVRQLVHHIADSHMIAFYRVRLALTEDWPAVTGYNEKAFALLPDVAGSPVEWSLELIESVHARWVLLLQSLTEEQWHRGFRHNERGPMSVEMATLLYAWHSRHHIAHIQHLCVQQGW